MKTFAASLFAAALAVLLTPPFLLPSRGQFVIDPYRFSAGGGGGTSPGTANLVSWWTLDEGSNFASGAADSHTTGNDLVVGDGNVTSATGKIGGALGGVSGNSPAANVAIVDTSAVGLEPSGDFSVSFWMKWAGDTATTSYSQPIGKYRAINGYRSWRVAQYADSGKLYVALSDDGIAFTGYGATTGADLDDDAWHHIVVLVDLGTSVKFYVDGVLDDTDTTSVVASVHGGSARPSIGGQNADAARNFNGLVDEAAFWSDLLTEDEITWLYNGGTGRTYSDL